MTITTLINQIPDYAKDIKLNLSTITQVTGAPDLSEKQIQLIALACANATKHPTVITTTLAESKQQLSETEIAAAQTAATIMAMNNVYYRFVHLVADPIFATLPAKLRMTVIGNPGIDKIDFELMCLAVSAINGCGMCMESHTRVLRQAQVTPLAIQSAIRIAAVFTGVAQALGTPV